MKVRLLHPDRSFDSKGPSCALSGQLSSDLELDTLVAAMADGDTRVAEVAEAVLLLPTTDPDVIAHRQSILADFLAHPELLHRLYDAAGQALRTGHDVWGFGYRAFETAAGRLPAATRYLYALLDHLKALRTIADAHLSSVGSPGLTDLFRDLQADLDDDYLEEMRRQLDRLSFRDGMWLAARLGIQYTGDDYTLVAPHEIPSRWARFHPSAADTHRVNVDPHDDGAGQALEDLTARGLNQIANAAAQAADHITGFFSALQTELAFYRGCLALHTRLAGVGQPVCLPQVADRGKDALAARGLADTCLALQTGRPIDGHDVDADGTTLIVITGANSGGKSTLLRSIGIAQLMLQAGMFVTADRYRSSPVSGVFTHFPRPEDPTMSRGRLEDELARMKTITDALGPGGLVLCNESFHSTNEQEGSELAFQVTSALRDGGMRVVYVTHQYDFARRFLAENRTTTRYLRAEPRSSTPPQYRIHAALPLPTAYGPDLYRAVFGAEPAK